MRPILSYILAILLGIIIGSIVNMGILMLGDKLLPFPGGTDLMDTAQWDIIHFFIPLSAHAIGTLAGAYTAALIAVQNKKTFALVIGFWFLLVGIMMVFIVPAPVWFICSDLALAYIPMSLLGWSLTK